MMEVTPAALNQKQAAVYCGLCVENFKKLCPVKPIQFTDSKKGHRWLTVRLDKWLADLDPNTVEPVQKRKFGDLAGG